MAEKKILYQDAIYSGYKLDIGQMGVNLYDELARWDKEILPDVHLYRPNVTTDYGLVQNKAFVTVNGFIHQTQLIDGKLWVKNATKSMLKTRINHLGLISLSRNPQNIVKINITDDMITSDVGVDLYHKLFITTEQEINYPVLIAGGYFILPNPIHFYRVSDKTFALALNHISFIEKLFELNRYRDIFNELEITNAPDTTDAVFMTDVVSDATIRKFMTLDNTFICDLNILDLEVTKLYLNQSTLVGTYMYDQEPVYPLVAGMGKFVEYWKKIYNERYVMRTADSYYNNLLFSRLPESTVDYINGHRDTRASYRLSNAYMLKMICTV